MLGCFVGYEGGFRRVGGVARTPAARRLGRSPASTCPVHRRLGPYRDVFPIRWFLVFPLGNLLGKGETLLGEGEALGAEVGAAEGGDVVAHLAEEAPALRTAGGGEVAGGGGILGGDPGGERFGGRGKVCLV